MKTSLKFAAFAVASLTSATGAFAQAAGSASQDVSATASVPSYCQNLTPLTGTAATKSIYNTTTGALDTSTQVFTVPGVTCNTAADVTAISNSNGVKSPTLPAAAPTNFSNVINYNATAAFGTASASVATDGTDGSVTTKTGTAVATGGATTGNLVISVTPVTPLKPLVAATDYSDKITVMIVPK